MSRKPPQFDGHPMAYPVPAVFRGFCEFVYDGDTQDFLVDLGWNQYGYVTVRLRSYDAWELTGIERDKGLLERDDVAAKIFNKPVRLTTWKDPETFGRYVAEIAYWENGAWTDLATYLRQAWPRSP